LAEVEALYAERPYDIDKDLIAYYPFDDGTANDQSGNGINGTLQNGAEIIDGGKVKTASFDGSDDYINLGASAPLAIPRNITISTWVKFSGVSSDARIIYRRSGNYGVTLWSPKDTGRLSFYLYSSAAYRADSTRDYNDDQWHHVVGTYDGSLASLYVDGILESETAASGDISYPTANSAIGRNANENNRYWDGLIDEVKIWARALSAAEVETLYLEDTSPSPV